MNEPDFKMSINSSAAFITGSSYQLRPWTKPIIDSVSSAIDTYILYWNIYGKNKDGADATYLELDGQKVFWNSSLKTVSDKNWKESFALEISGQAKMSLSSQKLNLRLHKEEPYLLHVPNDPVGIIASSVQTRKPLEAITTKDIIEWYHNVDPHGRIEGLLPNNTQFDKIDYILIPENLCTEEVLNKMASVFPHSNDPKLMKKCSSLLEKVVIVEGHEDSLEWQKYYFDHKCVPRSTPSIFQELQNKIEMMSLDAKAERLEQLGFLSESKKVLNDKEMFLLTTLVIPNHN
eukprot:TRINITY_DN18168_c0_g1_i3.p1 TRINITY_DN18168_c0_g1~~TRINITY_DN18168_c0_g1_i3.p1  ORF type:complete len:320 (-),score=93.60 TRINITY_DN18168_c0_g1_i3:3-872(-)